MNKTWFGVYSIIHSWKKGDDKRLLEMAKSLSENFNMDVTIFGFYPYKDTSPDTLEHGLYTYSEEGYVKKIHRQVQDCCNKTDITSDG